MAEGIVSATNVIQWARNVSIVRRNTDATSRPVQPAGAAYCHGPGWSAGGAPQSTSGACGLGALTVAATIDDAGAAVSSFPASAATGHSPGWTSASAAPNS